MRPVKIITDSCADLNILILGMEKYAAALCLISAVFMLIRHKENYRRLFNGTESKFSLSK